MRAAQALDHLTTEVRQRFPDDVANALIGDEDMFAAAARRLAHDVSTPEELATIVTDIVDGLDDGMADWLVGSAQAPAGWLYKQINEHV